MAGHHLGGGYRGKSEECWRVLIYFIGFGIVCIILMIIKYLLS